MTGATVVIVDDDQGSLKSLAFLIESMTLKVKTLLRPGDFLQEWEPSIPGCLVFDVRLSRHDCVPPIIFVTGHGDLPMSVRAIKAGAINFLQKPIHDQTLLDCINEAIEVDRRARIASTSSDEFLKVAARLTSRESEVTERLIRGRSLKPLPNIA